jgi:hypothetical protein
MIDTKNAGEETARLNGGRRAGGDNCTLVHEDQGRYAGEWPRERFQVHGIRYEPAELNRSKLYLAFLPLLNSGRLELLDHPRMVSQFVGLERRTSRAGRDTVDHPPHAHDDLANAVAGVAALMGSAPTSVNVSRETAQVIGARMTALGRRSGYAGFGGFTSLAPSQPFSEPHVIARVRGDPI